MTVRLTKATTLIEHEWGPGSKGNAHVRLASKLCFQKVSTLGLVAFTTAECCATGAQKKRDRVTKTTMRIMRLIKLLTNQLFFFFF